MTDLSSIAIIDAHSHALPLSLIARNDPMGLIDRCTITGMCIASSNLAGAVPDDFVSSLTRTTPFALGLVRELAGFLGCEPRLEAVQHARRDRLETEGAGYLQSLMNSAGIAGLVVDDGYPQPRIDPAILRQEYAVAIDSVVRIEPLILEALESATSWRNLNDAFAAKLDAAIAAGAIAIKSIIAYRSGLDIVWPSGEDLEAHFDRWRQAGFPRGRGGAKVMRDALAYTAADVAKRRGVPFHIHCGGGDSDILFEHARPACLFPFLKDRFEQDILLIHAGWPWTDEAAFIASVLPRVYVETSLATPWASLALEQKLTTLLGIAPPRKVLYGSDASSEPEILWFSARMMRKALARVLDSGIAAGWLVDEDAQMIAADVLAGNVRRLHRPGCDA
ncbi:MAG: amidohydrolase family protein [Parvibaculaceae bacterium]